MAYASLVTEYSNSITISDRFANLAKKVFSVTKCEHGESFMRREPEPAPSTRYTK
jgi:hypothetical protein